MFDPPCVAFLPGSSPGSWLVLLVVVLIVVGPKRLPEVARKLGRIMEMFRRAADEFKSQLMSMDQEPPPAPGPMPTESDAQSPYQDSSPYPGNEQYAEALNAQKQGGADIPVCADSGRQECLPHPNGEPEATS